MKTNIFILILFLILPNILLAQKKKSLILEGTISERGNKISYKLDLVLNKSNKLSGKSITDVNGKNELVSDVTGKLNSARHFIYFKENIILNKNENNNKLTFCYFEGTLSYVIRKSKIVVSGKYIGKDIAGKKCSEGTMLLYGKDVFSDSAKPKIPIVKEENITPKEEPKKTEVPQIISFKKINYYDYENKNLTFEVSDYDQEDGDIISVYMNNKVILEKYELTKKPKIINITTSANQNDTIYFYAHNEGYYPPNSAQLIIKDGNQSHLITATNEFDKRVYLILRKKWYNSKK